MSLLQKIIIQPRLETLEEMREMTVELYATASLINAPDKTMKALDMLMDDIDEMIADEKKNNA